jgi:transposase
MLMSKAEYTKHRGVSRQTVYSWIERGEVVRYGFDLNFRYQK